MKKYILTIKYNDSTDNIEWMQEEIIVENTLSEITVLTVASLTSEDMLEIMEDKEYAKA